MNKEWKCPICGSTKSVLEDLVYTDPHDLDKYGEYIICIKCDAFMRCKSTEKETLKKFYNTWKTRGERAMLDNGYLTCPCCGASPEVEKDYDGYNVVCPDCGLKISRCGAETAKEAWNGKNFERFS